MRGRRRGVTMTGAVLALMLAACSGPRVPSPLDGQWRYTCCNMHYEKPEISDVNFQQGTMIPFGTRAQILEVGKDRVKFQAEGYPPITLILKYGRKELPFDQYLDRVLVT